MKNYLTTGKAAAALLIILMAASNLFSQDSENKNLEELAIKNLIMGINSTNEGVKRSSIYYAGKYKITESVPSLLKVLGKEENPGNRVLIALVLYKVGTPEGLNAVKYLAANDKDSNVRRMATEIYNTYQIDYLQQVAALENQ